MNICVIPARAGSRRIPRKNIKEFNGKPIIAYSIEAALTSNCFSQVIVSTDDDDISEVAKKYGAWNEDLAAAERMTIVINEEGEITYLIHNGIPDARDHSGVLDAVIN